MKLPNGLSNEQNCSISLHKRYGEKYMETELKYKRPALSGCCDFYNSDNMIIPVIHKYCESCPKQSDKLCPIPAGNYMFNKYHYGALIRPPNNVSGDFKAIFEISQDGELLGGCNFYTTVIY
ncbi:unnamed protein product [Diamesa serratosioi]